MPSYPPPPVRSNHALLARLAPATHRQRACTGDAIAHRRQASRSSGASVPLARRMPNTRPQPGRLRHFGPQPGQLRHWLQGAGRRFRSGAGGGRPTDPDREIIGARKKSQPRSSASLSSCLRRPAVGLRIPHPPTTRSLPFERQAPPSIPIASTGTVIRAARSGRLIRSPAAAISAIMQAPPGRRADQNALGYPAPTTRAASRWRRAVQG